ncbi:MAG: hypothetical protein LIP23_04715, partial [Planctomycetes bacterium]|nr:hypothetical protein [Planctomycetota bacterium]
MRIRTVDDRLAIILIMIGLILSRGLAGAYASEPNPVPAGEQAAVVELSEEELGDILEQDPDHLVALEQLALIHLRRGDVRGAEQLYSRLLALTIDEAETALRHAVAMWHLRQEYEAQAALIAVAQSRGAASNSSELANAALRELYDVDGIIDMIRAEYPDEIHNEAVEAIAALWTSMMEQPALPLSNEGPERSEVTTVPVYGAQPIVIPVVRLSVEPCRAFLALWLGYSRLGKGDIDGAKREMRIALQWAPDDQSRFNARAGLRLIEGLAQNLQLSNLLDISFQVIATLPNATMDGSEDPGGLLDELENKIRDGDLDGANGVIAELRQFSMDRQQKGRYLYYLGEKWWGWNWRERAAQSYEAAQAVSDDSFTISDARFKLANYAASLGETDKAVRYAELAAEAAPNNPYRQREVGEFLIAQGRQDEGASYFEHAVEAASEPLTRAESYLALAERYKDIGYQERYLIASDSFADAIEEIGDDATDEEKGLAAYYRGQTLAARGDADGAFLAYEAAAPYLNDTFKRAEIFILMAEYQAERGNRERAAELAEQSLAELPNEEWKIRQISDFYIRIGMPEKAVAMAEAALENADSPRQRFEALRNLIALHRQLDNRDDFLRYAGMYRDAVNAPDFDPTANEMGLAWYYQGEIHADAGDEEQAYQAYEQAVRLLTDDDLASDILFRMAEYAAKRGDDERAADLAIQSAEKRHEDWVFRRTGDFLLRLNKPDEAFAYYDRAAKMANPNDNATAYAIMADAYSTRNDPNRYNQYAGRYVDAIASRWESASQTDRGLAAYYRGRILASRGETDDAYRAYEYASRSVTDPYRLSELYILMAEHKADRGEMAEAAELAEKSLALRPNEDWKIRQVADLYIRADMPDRAEALYKTNLERAATPRIRAQALRDLAELHKRLDNNDEYLRYAELYRDTVSAPDYKPNPDEEGMGWYYQGEIAAAAGDDVQAFAAYEKATELLRDDLLLSDVYQRMADYAAERGDNELAANLAEKSAEKHQVEWVFRRTGDFLFRLDMPDRAYVYYDRAVKTIDPEDNASAYAIMADAFNDRNNTGQYLRYAGRYVNAIAEKGADATDAEKGLAAYYRGKILLAAGDEEQAFQSYERASNLLTDRTRRSEVFIQMAEYSAAHGDRERAGLFAERSLVLMPHEDWKVRQVADFYVRADMGDKAVGLYEDKVVNATTPRRRAEAIYDLAELHKRLDHQAEYLEYAEMYRSLVTAPGFTPSANESGLGWYYQGEIRNAAGDEAGAYEAYEKATYLLTDTILVSDVCQRMAEFQAERGNKTRAAELAEMSADKRREDWIFRRTGEFLFKLDMPDKAFSYFDRSVKMSDPEDNATAYSIMADQYNGINDAEQYHRYASLYIDAVAAKGDDVTDAEKGLVAYYQGKILAGDGEYDEANSRFEQAVHMLKDENKLSESYRLMAAYQVEKGNYDLAADYTEKALAVLPGEVWLLNHVAGFYIDIDRPDHGIRHFEDFIARTDNPRLRAESYAALAELYRRMNNNYLFKRYARLYADAVAHPDYKPTTHEQGSRHFYLGDVATLEDRLEEAYSHYEQAAELFVDKNRLSEVAMRMAEYHAKRENVRQAARFAELSASHLPDEIWKQTSVAAFFDNLGMTDQALVYFNRAMAIAKTPEQQAQVYEALANYHREKGNTDLYVQYADAYIRNIASRGKKVSNREIGNSYFYTGEIHMMRKQPHQAYKAYERATVYVREPYLLSSIYFKMARYNIDNKNYDLAAHQALAGAGLLPNQRWPVTEAVNLLADLKLFDTAERIALQAISLNPENRGLYQTLAYMYFNKVGDRRTASNYHKMYIDYLYERNELMGLPAPKEQWEELWWARSAQNGIDRTWGLESYFNYVRYPSKDYWSGMSHQLYRNYTLKNGMFGKLYVQYGGSLDSQFTSYHYINEFDRSSSVSRSKLSETSYLLFGATIHPFPTKWLNGFELWTEYHYPIGDDAHRDFRVGAKYSRGDGDSLRPSGNFWHYWKGETNTWYSFEDEVWMSNGETRQGFTYVNDRDRHLLIIPYGLLTYLYDGNNSNQYWGSDIGLGLMLKKYFREDRYHLPRSTIELNVQYRWPLTPNRDQSLN